MVSRSMMHRMSTILMQTLLTDNMKRNRGMAKINMVGGTTTTGIMAMGTAIILNPVEAALPVISL